MKRIRSIACILCLIIAISLFSRCGFNDKKEPLHYVVLGDSIARGAGVTNSEEACYGKIVADTNGYVYQNYGIDGYTSWQLLELIRSRAVTSALKDADIVSISIGGNDYLQQDLPKLIAQVTLGNFQTVNSIQIDFRKYLKEILDYVTDVNPKAVILTQTLYNPRFDLVKTAFGEATKRVNEVVNETSALYPGKVYVIDTVPFIEGNPECVAADGIHPSAYGNEVIAGLVLGALSELGLGENTEPVIHADGKDQIPYSSDIVKGIKNFFGKLGDLFKPE